MKQNDMKLTVLRLNLTSSTGIACKNPSKFLKVKCAPRNRVGKPHLPNAHMEMLDGMFSTSPSWWLCFDRHGRSVTSAPVCTGQSLAIPVMHISPCWF